MSLCFGNLAWLLLGLIQGVIMVSYSLTALCDYLSIYPTEPRAPMQPFCRKACLALGSGVLCTLGERHPRFDQGSDARISIARRYCQG